MIRVAVYTVAMAMILWISPWEEQDSNYYYCVCGCYYTYIYYFGNNYLISYHETAKLYAPC